jgi:hypothetical protein
MFRRTVFVGLATLFLSRASSAEFRELRQQILGMD